MSRIPTPSSQVFKTSSWDVIPAMLAVVQLGVALLLYGAWPGLSWGLQISGLLLYAFSAGWNLNSIAHNFIHNPFFKADRLNRLMSMVITLARRIPTARRSRAVT